MKLIIEEKMVTPTLFNLFKLTTSKCIKLLPLTGE